MFRLLFLLASSCRIDGVAGHEIFMSIDNTALQRSEAFQNMINARMVKSAGSTLNEIDLEVLQRWAHESAGIEHRNDASDEYVDQLYATLYGLVLGILDDLLESTEIVLLNDRVRFGIVPMAVASSGDQSEEDGRGDAAPASADDGIIEGGMGRDQRMPGQQQQQPSRLACGATAGALAAAAALAAGTNGRR